MCLESGEMVIKRPGLNYKHAKHNFGGNRKWQTFKFCQYCGVEFGPIQRLTTQFCSCKCKISAQSTGRKVFRIGTKEAIRAQRILRYHIQTDHIVRPKACENCGFIGRIEGAHYNYQEPLRVRWLCRSCHVKWDKANPKNGTIIRRWEDYTGNKATLAK